jgi:hypothetical protein
VAGASDLPVLGPLFRSRQFRDRQTELVVFITPRFVDGAPMSPDAAAIGMGPMREPTRLGPTAPAAQPLRSQGYPADMTGNAPVGAADEGPPALGPDAATPGAAEADGSRRSAAEPYAGEDRGVTRRWRGARDRVRMVE